MAWNPQTQKRTLYIQKLNNGKYRLEQFVDVLTNEGVTYREPMPSDSMGLRHIEFDSVEFVTGQAPTKRDATAGPRNLVNTNSIGLQSRTAPA